MTESGASLAMLSTATYAHVQVKASLPHMILRQRGRAVTPSGQIEVG